jgi:hypothetical protein
VEKGVTPGCVTLVSNVRLGRCESKSPATFIPVGVDNKTGYGPSQGGSERPQELWGSLIRTESPGQKAAGERPWGSSLPTSERTY